jgi:hypothetical protein
MKIDYTDARQQVARIQQRLNETVESIRANRSLTAAGRKREIAAATLEARRKADQLRNEHAAERQEYRYTRQRIAFGKYTGATGSDVIADRDARDRAAQLKAPGDAKAMLAKAILHNDESLAKAVAAHAYDRGWRGVVERYGEAFDRQVFIDQLDDTPVGPRTDTADRIIFHIRNPQELGTASELELQTTADQTVADKPRIA